MYDIFLWNSNLLTSKSKNHLFTDPFKAAYSFLNETNKTTITISKYQYIYSKYTCNILIQYQYLFLILQTDRFIQS